MKKIATALFCSLLFVLVAIPSVFAAEWELVADNAGLLTETQYRELNERAKAISAQYQCEVAVVTVPDMSAAGYSDAYDYAKYLHQQHGYGYGEEKSCILLLLSTAERDYAVIAYDYGNTALTDYGRGILIDQYILPQLRNDRYYEAFSAYLDRTEWYLSQARAGLPFDSGTDGEAILARARTAFMGKLAVTILLPLLLAGVICMLWRRQMKTAVAQKTASQYIPAGGFRLTGQEDLFLFQNVTRRRIERADTSSSSGGTTTDSGGYSGSSGKY